MRHRLGPLFGAKCRPGYFDPAWYLETYDDVAAAEMDPLRHYLRYGRDEGRLPCFMTAAWRERDLRWGLLEQGEAALEALAGGGSDNRADQVWAALACGRAAARRGDWVRANAWLRPLDPEMDLIRGFCLPDIALLAIEAAVMVGDLPRARHLYQDAQSLFGRLPDLTLALANITAAETGFDRSWSRALTRMYARAGLSGVSVAPGDGSQAAFDRLQPIRPPRRSLRGHPLVSVVMPARNAAATLETALRSLRDQTWRALEILVVDNGSTDATAQIARDCAKRDPRIRVLDGSAEPGTYAARNLGVATATGAFITVLDADDWAHPARIARQVRALLRHSSSVASVSHWVRTTPDLRFTRWWREDGLVHRDVSSLMIRRAVLDRLGFWDRARAAADTEYYLRIQAVFGADAIREVDPGLPLSFGRVRSQSLTQRRDTGIETHLFGPRRDYNLAGQRWHLRMQSENALPLPQHPACRPYPIPGALALPEHPDPAPADSAGEWLSRSGLYDDAWYMQTYPDLRARNLDGILHFQSTGDAEGRDPGPAFSNTGYRMAHGPFDGSALSHYLQHGRSQGLSPMPVFDGALGTPPAGRHLLFFGHQARDQVFGAERCLLDMLDRACSAGYTPSVVLPQICNEDYLAALQARSHQVHVIPYGWIFGGVAPPPATVARLTTLIRDSGAIEIYQNTAVLDAPLYAARAAGVPAVVHVHELPAEDPRLCMDLGCTAEELRDHMVQLATRFVANSQAVQDWLALPADRVTLLPNTVPAGLVDLPFTPADRPRVALIGSLVAKKGISDFLRVANICAKAGVQADFIMIGPETPDLARLGPLPDHVSHAGYAATPEAAIAQADLVLSLSHFAESFGLTILEAMTAGRPVVCYDRGTPPALVADSGAGHVVPADDPAAVARAVQALLSNPERLQAASRAARHRADDLRRQAEITSGAALFPPVASGQEHRD
jgi:glycosyltransferase involved in cell wall biosynthesis